jgi:FtsP/CotA-like multicopper oxidase with cupredoxin domain
VEGAGGSESGWGINFAHQGYVIFVFHCHILQHEDDCMMGVLDVQAAAS